MYFSLLGLLDTELLLRKVLVDMISPYYLAVSQDWNIIDFISVFPILCLHTPYVVTQMLSVVNDELQTQCIFIHCIPWTIFILVKFPLVMVVSRRCGFCDFSWIFLGFSKSQGIREVGHNSK
jgi:hypothetical protein